MDRAKSVLLMSVIFLLHKLSDSIELSLEELEKVKANETKVSAFPDKAVCLKQINNVITSKRTYATPSQLEAIDLSFQLVQLYNEVEKTDGCSKNASLCSTSRVSRTHNITNNTVPEIAECRRMYVTIHGYASSSKSDFMSELKRGLLNYHKKDAPNRETDKNGSICVLVVNWEKGASANVGYPNASANTIIVGQQLAQLIDRLAETKRVKLGDIHMIGFSLGAQVAHYAALWLTLESKGDKNNKLKRITALDPTARCFTNVSSRLSEHDAQFVDVIHTAIVHEGGSFDDNLEGRFGIAEPIGTADFYANGGEADRQVCFGVDCSHRMSVTYFVDSLDMNTSRKFFRATKCESLEKMAACEAQWKKEIEKSGKFEVMGIDTSSSARGIYFVNFLGRSWLMSSGKCSMVNNTISPENCDKPYPE